MDFRFTPDILGRYPTYVGFVITQAHDPFRDVEFALNTLTPEGDLESPHTYDPLSWVPRLDSFSGDTRTHRFFGVHVPEGMDRLIIYNIRQLDHLQYGYAIPEPGSVVLLVLAGMAGLGGRRRR